jgi:hypothetical protein
MNLRREVWLDWNLRFAPHASFGATISVPTQQPKYVYHEIALYRTFHGVHVFVQGCYRYHCTSIFQWSSLRVQSGDSGLKPKHISKTWIICLALVPHTVHELRKCCFFVKGSISMIRILQFKGINEHIYDNLQEMIAHVLNILMLQTILHTTANIPMTL